MFLNEPCDCVVFTWPFARRSPVFCPSGHNTLLTRGTRETAGGGQKRMRADRDRWMEEAEREDCEGGTDGGEKGDSSEEGSGGPREEGD